VFDAIVFLSGTVLFFVAVLFFIFAWREHHALTGERTLLATEQQALSEQKVELDIWQRELQVWYSSLQSEQRQLEEDKQKLLILAAPQQTPNRQQISTVSLSPTPPERKPHFQEDLDTQQVKVKRNK
jgi:hypothetical protein